ncbi:Methionyl-tRNA formyltransferase, mitochondrial [Orchesella cincta]|uniref:methionyl-tRNA formyltransferase n=1 Tax=Orchesella cincta TaxID=48709 RepID=A0A1D2MEL9_ORCCI|nr:Methionyl-tRNA formyltransferase, mitochondrial [Orchesella cincta]
MTLKLPNLGINWLPRDTFDFGVVASFGYLIPAKVINRFPLGILNVHGSLLPQWRGASPIAHSIMFGDSETGISIMKIAPHRFDIGPVFLTKKVPLDPHIKEPDLRSLLAEVGATALTEVIKNLPNFLNNPIYQDERLATKAPKLVPEMADVDWTRKSAVDVYRLFLALYGTFKLKTTFKGRSVDLDDIELPVFIKNDAKHKNFDASRMNTDVNLNDLPKESVPGQIVYVRNMILVKCCDPTWVVIKKVKVGVKWMNPTDFKNGYLSKGKVANNVVTKFEYLNTPVFQNSLANS